ncbi:MAG: hypothetical protein J5729_00310 [Bacteroidaceae bacterium]|nr:hypothetical protein [Bacteroidaceae bacterium]MBR4782955.1 hypothetical protein [Bacteroidaceae bacterium]
MKNTVLRFLITAVLLAGLQQVRADIKHTPAYYDQNARELFKKERWQEGKKILDAGMKLYGGLSNLNELAGWYYYHYGKYDQARFYLIRSLRDDHGNSHSRELIIDVEERTKNYSSAICYVNEMLEVEPYSLRWWRRKIKLYRLQGNNDEADRLLIRLRMIYPNEQQVQIDVAYQLETKYRISRRANNVPEQIRYLRELVKMQPKEEEFYLRLSNLLLQTGHTEEAAEVAGQGAATLNGNANLIRKKTSILTDAGRYVEALSYIKSCQQVYHAAWLTGFYKEIQLEAARAAQQNDAYALYAKVYADNPSAEALDYLINTAIARGYYEDAIAYLRDARKGRGETEDVLYKEYIVNQRLGNKTAANNLLEKLYYKNPKNTDVADLYSRIRLDWGASKMDQGQYREAISDLQFAAEVSPDKEIKRAALTRLYNCYLVSRDYNSASTILEQLNENNDYTAYTTQKATLTSLQGKTRDALEMLYRAYNASSDAKTREYIATAYEEMATPYIKKLIEIGAVRQAYEVADQAVELCPNSADLLRMAITTSSLLGKNMSYINYVAKARANFPEDPEFIAKEAAIYTMSKEYDKALAIIRPQLDVYPGDSTLIGAFSENSETYAMALRKQKSPYQAMAVIDTALVFDRNNRMLLYTKGLVYEDLREYDSAYVYQSYYDMTLADFQMVKRKLNEIKYKSFADELYIEYQQARLGAEDAIVGNACLSYTRKYTKNQYTGTISYAGRDGTADDDDATDLTEGGVGMQFMAGWQHQFRSDLSGKAELAWANKYFPQILARVSGQLELRNDWTAGLGLCYRRVQSYSGIYGWKENDNGQGGTTNEYQRLGWKMRYTNMLDLTGTASKTFNKFHLSAGASGILLDMKNIYFNTQLKAAFFPVIGDRSNVFTTFGIGNAPATVLIDRSLPAGFNHVNTSVSLGGLYVHNQHLTLGFTGEWYTLFNKTEGLYTGLYETTPSILSTYKNYFYIHAQVIIAF